MEQRRRRLKRLLRWVSLGIAAQLQISSGQMSRRMNGLDTGVLWSWPVIRVPCHASGAGWVRFELILSLLVMGRQGRYQCLLQSSLVLPEYGSETEHKDFPDLGGQSRSLGCRQYYLDWLE